MKLPLKSDEQAEHLIVYNIKKFAIHDGPGIRMTIFLKGCPLRCAWCHNPEGIPQGVEVVDCANGKPVNSGDYVNVVENGNKQKIGAQVHYTELFHHIMRDKPFYDASGGGVTISGGDPLFQWKPLVKLLKKCKEAGIHTTIDTSGFGSWQALEALLPYTDLFLYDVKHIDSEEHKKGTGVKNELILANLIKLDEKGANIGIRIPLIGGFNDNEDTFRKIGKFIKEELKNHTTTIKSLQIFPFNSFAHAKFTSLGKVMDKTYADPIPDKMLFTVTKAITEELGEDIMSKVMYNPNNAPMTSISI